MNLNILKSNFNAIEFETDSSIPLSKSNIMLYINNTPLYDFNLTASSNNTYTITSNIFFDGIVALYLSFTNLSSNIILLYSTAYFSQGIITLPLKLFSSLGSKATVSVYKINSEILSPAPECIINISNPIYGGLSTIELNKLIFKNTDLLELYINLNKNYSLKPLDGFYELELYLNKIN